MARPEPKVCSQKWGKGVPWARASMRMVSPIGGVCEGSEVVLTARARDAKTLRQRCVVFSCMNLSGEVLGMDLRWGSPTRPHCLVR